MCNVELVGIQVAGYQIGAVGELNFSRSKLKQCMHASFHPLADQSCILQSFTELLCLLYTRPGLGSGDVEKKTASPLYLGGPCPAREMECKQVNWLPCVYGLSSLSVVSLLQERKPPSLQAPVPAGLSQPCPLQQRGQEELTEPQRPFNPLLKTWHLEALWGQENEFPVGTRNEVPFPGFQDRSCQHIAYASEREAGGKRDILSLIFPFSQWEINCEPSTQG